MEISPHISLGHNNTVQHLVLSHLNPQPRMCKMSLTEAFFTSNECWVFAPPLWIKAKSPFSQHLMNTNPWYFCFKVFLHPSPGFPQGQSEITQGYLTMWQDLFDFPICAHWLKNEKLAENNTPFKDLSNDVSAVLTVKVVILCCFHARPFQGHTPRRGFRSGTLGSWPWTKWPPPLSITSSTKNKRKWCR